MSTEADKERAGIVARLEKAKAAAAELETGRTKLVALEHELTQRIAKLSPLDGVKARTERAAVLEAIADAAQRLETAGAAVSAAKRELEFHDVLHESSRRSDAYFELRTRVLKKLEELHPLVLELGDRADEVAEIGRKLNSQGRAHNPRPLGLRVLGGRVELVEGPYFMHPTAWELPEFVELESALAQAKRSQGAA